MAIARLIGYTTLLGTSLFFARRTYRLYNNYLIARKLGIKIIIIPIGWQDDIWLLLWEYFTWLKWIPGVSYWFDFSRFCWTQDYRHQPHREYGDAFVIVSPGGVELIINDPAAVVEVQTRYKDWYKDPAIFELFDIFGKNVVTANDKEWQRHVSLQDMVAANSTMLCLT
jgi:hypothetical protein